MIQSKHDAFGFWFLLGAMAFFTFLTLCCITQYYFDFTIIRIHIPNQKTFNAFMTIHGIAFLVFGLTLSYRASSISINCQDQLLKTISFKNLYTRQVKTYTFEDLDGYITTRLWHRQFNQNKTICLIQQGKVVKKIDNFFYSNVDELESGLEGLKYLGFINMGITNSWKVFFNQPIISH